MADKLDSFFAQEPTTEADTVEVETTETPQVVEEVTSEPEAEAQAETQEPTEQTEAATTDRKDWVPVKALQDERSRARTAIDEANNLRQRIAAMEAAQRIAAMEAAQRIAAMEAAQQAIPDSFDDPTGYAAYQQQMIQQQVQQQVALQNLNFSRQRAVAKYGEETMNEVADWAGQQAAADPTFEARLFAQADPAEWVVSEKKRREELDAFTSDRDGFIRREIERLGLQTAAPQAQVETPPAAKVRGPASIVNAKSRDTTMPENPRDSFDAIFSKSARD